MVSSNIPHADIVAHDDEDIGFLSLLLPRGRNARNNRGGTHHEKSAADPYEKRGHACCFPWCRPLKQLGAPGAFARARDNLKQGAAPPIDPDQCGLLWVDSVEKGSVILDWLVT
jgi:hypothetical protein